MCGRHTGERSALEDRLSGLPCLGGNGYVPLQQVEESSVTRHQQLISQEAVSTRREPGPERTETGRRGRRKSRGELPRRRQERAHEGRVIRVAAEEAQAHSIDQEHTRAPGWVEPESIRLPRNDGSNSASEARPYCGSSHGGCLRSTCAESELRTPSTLARRARVQPGRSRTTGGAVACSTCVPRWLAASRRCGQRGREVEEL